MKNPAITGSSGERILFLDMEATSFRPCWKRRSSRPIRCCPWVTSVNGMYKSVDGGESWTLSGTLNQSGYIPPVIKLVIDPQNPQTLYAGSNGVHKTIDGDESWKPVLTRRRPAASFM